MYHKHNVYVRFYVPNKVWVIEQPGEEDIYLYPNGTLKVGYDGESKSAYNNQPVQLELGFE